MQVGLPSHRLVGEKSLALQDANILAEALLRGLDGFAIAVAQGLAHLRDGGLPVEPKPGEAADLIQTDPARGEVEGQTVPEATQPGTVGTWALEDDPTIRFAPFGETDRSELQQIRRRAL